ncbi:MAG: o-succinylbenzoate synthase [Opitutaceae bacterium]|nr:o-succinylbenzoate synthase [Cytophagales bacterium]
MIKVNFQKHILKFKFDAGTSRGVLKEKETWFIKIFDNVNPDFQGVGECGPLRGLSIDDIPEFEDQLKNIIDLKLYNNLEDPLFQKFPSIRFAFEAAFLDLRNGGTRKIFDNDFYSSKSRIPINGLIWMGAKEFMLNQVKEKLDSGFSCLKMKVGSIDFETEIEILSTIRSKFGKSISLRLDANGAFLPLNVFEKLRKLEPFDIHSIEQPIKQGQLEEIALVCQKSPIPIALDEELINIYNGNKSILLEKIKPQYIILKPTLLGGFKMCDEWISLAEKSKVGWWLTSALESNIGLNAISQYAFEKIKNFNPQPLQGLGTGSLYQNNINSPLQIESGNIFYNQDCTWGEI